MDKKSIAWLLKELPELVSKGILLPETSENLRQYYSQISSKEQKRNFMPVLAITGFLLIALGVILILGHNWDALTRSHRFAISIGVLLLAQIFAGLSLFFKRGQSSFTESSSVFLALMIGASIAITGQTYHLSGDIDVFLLAWIFLSLPLIYIMRSTVTAFLYLALIILWLTQSQFELPGKHLVWLLIASVLPFYKSLWNRDNFVRHTTGLGFALVFAFLISFGINFQEELYSFAIFLFIYIFLFSIMYLGDIKISFLNQSWQEAPKPFRIIGYTGILGISFLLSTRFFWEYFYFRLEHYVKDTAFILIAILFVLLLTLLALTFRHLEKRQLLLSIAPLVVTLGIIMFELQPGYAISYSTLIFNIYFLAVSLMTIINGINKDRLGLLNWGMFMLSALILARFFDFNFSFEVRGIAFMLLGLSLLFINLFMFKRLKRKKAESV